jgi:hypothetical protein
MSFCRFNVPFERERYARELATEAKHRRYLAEKHRWYLEERAANAEAKSADPAGPGSDRGADGYATDRDESKSDQQNW